MEWQENVSQLHTFIKDVTPTPSGFSFSRPAWVRLNRLQTGVGLLHSETHKWGMASAAACECGAKKQITKLVIASCPIYHHPKWSPYSLRGQQEPGYLADRSIYGHVVDQPAPVHLPQTKKRNKT